MEQNDPFFDKINETIVSLKTKGVGVSRYGCADADGSVTTKSDYACCAAARSGHYTKADYFFLVWPGDPLILAKRDPDAKTYGTDRDSPCSDRNVMTPGPLSDAWLEFILSPELSPWKAILPHLVSTDPVIIRDTGLIIKNPKDINFGLYYNFIIACRYTFEFSHRGVFWKELVEDHGVDPRAAYLISIGYKKAGVGAKKPPLRKVLVKEAGYRKNAGGFRFIRDEWGDKQWFEAEYNEVDDYPDWKPGKWDGKLTEIGSCNHTPLPGIRGYATRVLKSDANLGAHKTLGNTLGYGPNAWDIFKTPGEPRPWCSDLGAILKYFQDILK